MSMGTFKVVMGVYISYKFGGLLSSTSVVNGLNCVQQASIGTQVNSSTVTIDNTTVFRYYSLGGDTAMPGGLYTRVCHAFLVFKHNKSDKEAHLLHKSS